MRQVTVGILPDYLGNPFNVMGQKKSLTAWGSFGVEWFLRKGDVGKVGPGHSTEVQNAGSESVLVCVQQNSQLLHSANSH